MARDGAHFDLAEEERCEEEVELLERVRKVRAWVKPRCVERKAYG